VPPESRTLPGQFVPEMGLMLRVGLTGGIASGKSTVAARMTGLGLTVLNADALAHRLIEPGQPAYDDIVREFGREILRADGTVDRKKLGDIVFREPARRERLNQIVHPRVIEAREEQLKEMESQNPRGLAIVEAALLIEAGYYKKLDRLVVCSCRPEQQMERLRARGLTEEEARQRIESQLPLAEKLRLADDVVDCSGTLQETERQTDALVARLRQLAAGQTGEGETRR
jgi:dephospho-CoA kinase